jgi:hypothetical protein
MHGPQINYFFQFSEAMGNATLYARLQSAVERQPLVPNWVRPIAVFFRRHKFHLEAHYCSRHVSFTVLTKDKLLAPNFKKMTSIATTVCTELSCWKTERRKAETQHEPMDATAFRANTIICPTTLAAPQPCNMGQLSLHEVETWFGLWGLRFKVEGLCTAE